MKVIIYKTLILALCVTGLIQAQSIKHTGSTANITNERFVPATVKNFVNNFGQKGLLTAICNQVFVTQVGNNNKAYINQILGGGLNPNFASIEQSNDNNNASITQTGSGNKNSIVQNGNGNDAKINVNGENNSSSVIQNGNNNLSVQDIKADNKNFLVTQEGDNNVVWKYDNVQTPKVYIISQKGNGLHLIIAGN